ncbi:MAG: SDR family oxidoreductase [Nitrospirota bacterium]|jgi:3-oxoacyl-[acyl-carrier protein] reductase
MLRTALVTGGSRGLGGEIARALSARGYRVALNYLRGRAEAAALASELGGGALPMEADVGDPKAVESMASLVREKWGRLDVLVNNAGITSDSPLIKLREEDWDRVLGINLKGCFNTMRALFPLMMETGGGHIVNVSSISGLRGREGQAAYSASKAALLGLSASAAAEFSPHGIRVNSVLPGYMPTGMGSASPGAMEAARKRSLLGRLSDPKEAAEFVAWLVGTGSITGQVFVIDSRL